MSSCDKKHLGCKGSDGPHKVNRGRFTIGEDGSVTYTQDYLIAEPTDAYSLLGELLPGTSACAKTVSGRQDSCGEWIATVTYETQPGEVDVSGNCQGDCPEDELVISGSAISSSWTKHPCFDEPVDGPPFNGARPSCFWGYKVKDLPPELLDQSDCFQNNPILEKLDPKSKENIPGFNYSILKEHSGQEFASGVFGGSTNFYAGSFEAQSTEYFTGSPPPIFGIVGYPAQPPGIPSSDGIYGTVITGAVYEPGQGHPCGRRVLSYLLSTQPWPSINPNGCEVITPP